MLIIGFCWFFPLENQFSFLFSRKRFDLVFASQGLAFGFEPLEINQSDGLSRTRVAPAFSRVVQANASLEIVRVAAIVRTVAAF